MIRRHSLIFSFFLVFFSLVPTTHVGHCFSITLAWDPNPPEESVIGYRLYFGTENDFYSYVIDTHNSALKKVKGLKKGQLYYFAVTAYNEQGLESGPSEGIAVSTCTYKLAPRKKTFKDIGGIGSVKVKTQPDCEWGEALSEASWLIITDGGSGVGSSAITYRIEPNDSSEMRVGIFKLTEEMAFTVKQRGKKTP